MKHLSILKAAPHIFRRPLLYVAPSDSVLQAATFLAIGPQIYVDGLVVLRGGALAGRIGGCSLTKHILDTKEKWLEYKAADIAEPLSEPFRDVDLLEWVFHLFAETKFAFVPVAAEGEIVASLSIRDLLGVASNMKTVVDEIASPTMTIQNSASVLDALEMMVNEGVRNLVLIENDYPYVINDRKILEYLLGHESRTLVSRSGFDALTGIKLKQLGMLRGMQVDPKSSAGSVAPLLSSLGTSCVFAGRKIVTPWDIVMKGSGFID
jgi:CBS domain-containing protein